MRTFTVSRRDHTTEDGSRRSARRHAVRARRRERLIAAVLAPVLILGGVGLTALGAAVSAAAALPEPTATIALRNSATSGEAEAKPFILAGEDATFDVSLRNGTVGANGYNIGFTIQLPAGISFVGADKLGSPVVYGPGESLPNSATTPPFATVPAGRQLWVFEDVSDLPASATYRASVTLRPDADLFPVGASPRLDMTGYISGDPELKPMFDGSTGRGGQAALAETSLQTVSADLPVKAVRLTKAEPSPESELLRGAHDNQTTYTLTVETTPEGTTEGITIVDYLPAGLEFLGCATADNTLPSALLFTTGGLTGGTREYPGAGDLATGRLASDARCEGPAELVSVETIDAAQDDAAPTATGVYTKVTWTIPPRSGGSAQSFPTDPGVPQVTEITYAAAVPLFENTLDFVTDAGGAAPSAGSLAQAANLNNNNGPSTRHGQDASRADDGIVSRNIATVTGTYAGPVTSGASRESSDSDREEIHAMDLRILKSVDTGDGDQFVTGQLATFTLDIAASEYAGASEIVVTDTLPNGLCPAVAGIVSDEPVPSECEAAMTGTVSGATLLPGSTYEPSTGRFILRPSVPALDAGEPVSVTYPALMRAGYEEDDDYAGPTSSGDALVNTVEITAETTPLTALDGVVNGAGAAAAAPETVWDDSSASITSTFSTIDKRVLPRSLMLATSTPTAADACAVAPAGGWEQNQNAPADTPFHIGDYVCYELTVDFAQSIDVRNPQLTDFLPAGVDYVDTTVYTGPGGTSGIDPATVDATVTGQRVQWTLGRLDSRGDRTVDLGSKLVLHLLGMVTEQTAADSSSLDKPENLMKYQQQNVHGDLYFLRDAAAIQTGVSPTLVKGVQRVDGGAENAFGSDVDGVRVQGGDEVDFRVDLTGGSLPVSGLVVWDLLPEGITSADVSDVSDSGTVVDPGQPGYPANVEDPTRSVIVWTGVSLDAAGETAGTRSLTYRVTMPADVEAASSFVNDAAIIRYAVEGSTGVASDFYPEGSLDTTPRSDDQRVPGADTRDPSEVFTPSPTLVKSLVSTEIGSRTNDLDPGRNSDTQAVAGELITWDYSVTIPAETTVTDAVLRDRGLLTPGNRAFQYVSSSWTGPSSAGFVFTGRPTSGPDAGYLGVLRFPASYTNVTTQAQTFTVTLTGYLPASAASGLAHGATLRNTASFDSRTWDATRQATVQYITPTPRIVKEADPAADVEIGEAITYTLTMSGTGSTAFDTTVTDEVPVGLLVDTSTFSVAPSSFDPGVATGDGGTITWNAGTWSTGTVPPTRTITYEASIEPGTGGGTHYVNTATITGHTLPGDIAGNDTTDRRAERTDEDEATVVATRADMEKQVRIVDAGAPFSATATAPIGATAEYRIRVRLEPNINYYDPVITDVLPAGVTLVPGSVSAVSATPSTGIADAWTFASSNGRLTWTYASDIPFAGEERVLELTYRALLSDAATIDDLDNTADFAWNRVNGDSVTRESIDDTAEVDVLNPVLSIDKGVSDAAPEPGDDFTYTLTIANTGSTAAHNIVITDDVPAGVVVDAATISHGGVLTGADATNGGGTITWTLAGPLAVTSPTSAALTLAYQAGFAPSTTLTDDLTRGVYVNTASVDEYESYPEGGRHYAPTDEEDSAAVDPAFPAVTVTKTVTDGETAYAGDPFGWTLTLTSTGAGDARITEVRDVLPANWEYDEGSARIRMGAAAPIALADPVVTADDAGDGLSWDWGASPRLLAGSPAAAGAPSRTLVITFTATPTRAALTTPGVTAADGTRAPHVNTLSATTVDGSGADGNADGAYTGPDDQASAFLESADLVIEKEASADPLEAGAAAAAAWTLTVRNAGPDVAVGPFVVRDVPGDLPDHFTITGLAGDGWTCAPDGDEFECGRVDSTETLAAGAAFPQIVVTAQAGAGFDTQESPVTNTATVAARTFDPDDSNNESDDDVRVVAEADLSLVKDGPSTAPNAGSDITWTIRVANTNGPADSLSTASAPITVTDVIPAGVDGVTVVDLPSGWTSSATSPIGAGDTLTLTQDAGGRIPVGGSVVFTLTGTVDADFADGDDILNEATVEPGLTPDPVRGNNTDDTTTTPTTDTTLAIVKQRVVSSGGSWVPAVTLSPVPAPVAGDPVSYLVTVTNTGTAVARGVTFTDNLEDYLALQSSTDVEGTWSVTPGSAAPHDAQTFALAGDLAPGASASVRLTLTLDETHTGPVVNAVEAAGDNVTNTPTDTDDSSGRRSADWGISKTHAGQAVAGESLSYTVTATQNGPSVSSGPVSVVDVLPDGFSLVAGSATVAIDGGAPVAVEPETAGQELTWSFGATGTTFPVGTGIVIAYRADIDPAVSPGPSVNRVTIDAPDDDEPSNDTAEDPATVVSRADLGVTKSAASGPHVAGETVAYELVVSNSGPSVARDVVVGDLLPAGLTAVALSGEGWDCDVDTVRCTLDVLPVGSSTVEVTARIDRSVAEGVELTNTAEVASSTPDDDVSNNRDDETITVVAEADLSIVKTAVDADGAEIDRVTAGGQLRYVLAVANPGPSDAVGPLRITDTLPDGFSLLSVVDGGEAWSCSADAADLVCTSPDGLAAGADAVPLTILVGVDAARAEGAATNVATVTSETTDRVPENDTDEATVEVVQNADLAIVKSHSGPVRIGTDLAFDLRATNQGPSVATGVTVVDTIPRGLEFVSATSEGDVWTIDAQPGADGATVLTAVLGGSLAPGEEAPVLRVVTTVTAAAYPGVVNSATVDAEQDDRDPADNTADDEVVVPALAALQLEKNAVGVLEQGEDGMYEITVTNVGPTEDPGPITIVDELPTGLRFVSSSGAADCVDTDGRVACLLDGALAAGDSVTLRLVVAVGFDAPATITNVAAVESATAQDGAKTTAADVSPVVQRPLPGTGGVVPWAVLVLALVLLAAGALFARRRTV